MHSEQPKTEHVLAAGLALQAEGLSINGFSLRNKVGGGSPAYLRCTWESYLASQSDCDIRPVVELPLEMAEEVKLFTSSLADSINQLAIKLSETAIRTAEHNMALIIRAAIKQQSQAEQEMIEAEKAVNDSESNLKRVQLCNENLKQSLEAERMLRNQLENKISQLKEQLNLCDASSRCQQERIKTLKNVLNNKSYEEPQMFMSHATSWQVVIPACGKFLVKL